MRLQIDADYVYFITFGTGAADGTLVRVKKDDGEPTTLASDLATPGDLALTSDALIWTQLSTLGPGQIWKINKDGTNKTMLYTNRRMPLTGDPIQIVASMQTKTVGIAADATASSG